MKIRHRLKRPPRITLYKPSSRIIISETQLNILKRLNIPLEKFAKEMAHLMRYKRRYT